MSGFDFTARALAAYALASSANSDAIAQAAATSAASAEAAAESAGTANLARFATMGAAAAAQPLPTAPVLIEGRANSLWEPTNVDYPATHAAGEGVWWYEDATGTVRVIAEPIISLTHLGGVGDDGATDNTVAWTELVKAGEALHREVRVPKAPGYFKVTRPAYARDGTALRMAGDIRNTRLNTDPGFIYGQHFAILFGNWSGDLIDSVSATAKFDVLATINQGQMQFEVSLADAAEFSVGDVVILFTSGDMYNQGGASNVPRGSDVNEVTAIDTSGATALLSLKYPVKEIIDAAPKVINGFATGVSDLLGNPAKWVKDVTVIDEGGSFASDYERWTGYGGMLRARIAAFAKKTSRIFSANGVAYSTIDVGGFFSQGGFEIAYLSQDSLVQSTRGIVYDGTGSAGWTSVITVAEYARRLTINNFRGTGGYGAEKGNYLLALTNAKDCVIGGNVRIDGDAITALVDATGPGNYGGHRFLPGSVFAGNAANGIRAIGGISDIEFNGVRVVGTFSAFGINASGDDLVFRGVYHATGNVNIAVGSERTVLGGLRSAAVRTIADAGTATQRANNYEAEAGIADSDGLRTITLADDTAFSFQAPAVLGIIEVGYSGAASGTGRAIYKTNNPSMAAVGAPGDNVNFVAAGGALAGTTSTDAKLNVSCQTDGRICLENRTGATQAIWFKL